MLWQRGSGGTGGSEKLGSSNEITTLSGNNNGSRKLGSSNDITTHSGTGEKEAHDIDVVAFCFLPVFYCRKFSCREPHSLFRGPNASVGRVGALGGAMATMYDLKYSFGMLLHNV